MSHLHEFCFLLIARILFARTVGNVSLGAPGGVVFVMLLLALYQVCAFILF